MLCQIRGVQPSRPPNQLAKLDHTRPITAWLNCSSGQMLVLTFKNSMLACQLRVSSSKTRETWLNWNTSISTIFQAFQYISTKILWISKTNTIRSNGDTPDLAEIH